ncbi:unnamed protein product, partial [marine sediment metagenome]
DLGTLVSWAKAKTALGHCRIWWYRRIVALALEGHIDAKVNRTGDKLSIRFRRKQEAAS